MTTQYTEQAARDLDAAADFMAEVGFVKGKLQDPTTGAVCMLGAIEYAPRTRDKTTAARALKDYIAHAFGHGVPAYNDATVRREAEAINQLHKAAVWVRNQIGA